MEALSLHRCLDVIVDSFTYANGVFQPDSEAAMANANRAAEGRKRR